MDTTGQKVALPVYELSRTATPIKVDGKLNDAVWATFKTRDQHLWEEAVEVFLQADSHQTTYVELEVNPIATMLDIFLLDVRKPLRYESWNSQKLKWG